MSQVGGHCIGQNNFFPVCRGNSERAETTGIKPFFTSSLLTSMNKMNGQAVVGKPHYQRVIWIVVRKIVSTWPIHWEKGMRRWMTTRSKEAFVAHILSLVPALPFFFIRHTQARWRNVMEKPFECIMCTANGLTTFLKVMNEEFSKVGKMKNDCALYFTYSSKLTH